MGRRDILHYAPIMLAALVVSDINREVPIYTSADGISAVFS